MTTSSAFPIRMGPIDPPSRLAFRAGRILSGEVDGEIKAAKKESSSSDTNAVSMSSTSRASPLSRMLALRLKAAESLLEDANVQLPSSKLPIGSASEDDLHLLTAQTALTCLQIIHREDFKISRRSSISPEGDDLIGSKDRKTLQTLLSLVSSWGLEPAILSYDAAIEAQRTKASPAKLTTPRFQEITATSEQQLEADHHQNLKLSRKHLARLFIDTRSLLQSHDSPPTLISTGLVPSQLLTSQQTIATHLMAAALRICWGPGEQNNSGKAPLRPGIEEARDSISFLLKTLPPNLLLPILSSLSSPRQAGYLEGHPLPPIPAFVRHFSTRLMAAQLLRREGIVALISSVMKLGEDSSEDSQTSPTMRLDGLAGLLTSPPAGMDRDVFLTQHTLPALVSFIVPTSGDVEASTLFAKVASYTLEKLSTGKEEVLVKAALKPIIWEPFWPVVEDCGSAKDLPTAEQVKGALHSLEVLVLCSTSLSSLWIKWLIRPVVFRLWELLSILSARKQSKVNVIGKAKATDASQLDQVRGILQKWLTVCDTSELTNLIRQWTTIQFQHDDRVYFEINENDLAVIRFGKPPSKPLEDLSSLLSSASLLPGDDAIESTARAMLPHLQAETSMQPPPSLFVDILSQAGRSDLASSLLPHLLEMYLSEKSRSTTQAWYLLQFVVNLLDAFGDSMVKQAQDTANVLRFVNACLGGARSEVETQKENRIDASEEEMPFIRPGGQCVSAMEGLLNASNGQPHQGTSEVDEEIDEDLIKTSLDLLLSVLESHPDLTLATTPLLRLIESKLPRFTSPDMDEDLRRVAKEARLVLFAREKASQLEGSDDEISTLGTSTSKARQTAQRKYEEALKLLQDPILPVRAHGLVLLKEIAATKDHPEASAHLLPSIMDIVLRAIGDEESYLYLNAIAALKAVLLRGEPYLSQVVARYARADGESSTKSTDERLRLGEALLATVQHLAEGGAVYLPILLPPLLDGLRDPNNSTTLKSSVLTLLGTCVEAFPLAFASSSDGAFVLELARGCLDLLRLEMVRRAPTQVSSSKQNLQKEAGGEVSSEEEEEEDPRELKRRLRFAPGADDSTSLDPSYPQLRRGALLALHLLIKGTRDQIAIFLEEQMSGQIGALGREGGRGGRWERLRLPGGGVLPSLLGEGDADGGLGMCKPSAPSRREEALPPLLFPLLKDKSLPSSTLTLTAYLAQEDDDALVRRMASEAHEELSALQLDLVQGGIRFGGGG